MGVDTNRKNHMLLWEIMVLKVLDLLDEEILTYQWIFIISAYQVNQLKSSKFHYTTLNSQYNHYVNL